VTNRLAKHDLRSQFQLHGSRQAAAFAGLTGLAAVLSLGVASLGEASLYLPVLLLLGGAAGLSANASP